METIDASSRGQQQVMELLMPATMAAGLSLATWLVLPRLLRRCHSYVESGPKARILGRAQQQDDGVKEKPPTPPVSYEMSLFGALEDPARLLATTITFSYLGGLVAPRSLGLQYLSQFRAGTTVVSLVWFLYGWKRNVFSRIMSSGRSLSQSERERYLTMDRILSAGMLLLGAMALAESCGVAVQSVLTVGGIGGVATAFAAKDLLGNMLSGVSLQFLRPFSVGDFIRAGAISGQVVDIGLHSTQMINSDKYPIIVPNSFFSSEVIVNMSRIQWRGLALNLPIKLKDFNKMLSINAAVREMLHSHPKIYLENENPRCNVSQVGPASFELAITCDLKPMSTDEFLLTEDEILMEISNIVARSGAALGTSM
ncbi:hypothetical protein BDL97_06G104500 [Sphagnum fallax]|uniref:Mechanosensitive ion channel MscS domain-containing protein n=1 Tax=Sphagnum jensenii TaxID=128206 RepID=A0ABP0X7T3_9BRYO|nr:hypothetical protein BDL97_06G104500 [Sphagnum fallax]